MAASQASRVYRQGGVWRPGVLREGLPKYTIEASSEELSLGIGRKEAEGDEHTVTDTTASRQVSIVSTAADSVDSSPSVDCGVLTEVLPPYIPPPPPAVVAEKRWLARGSYQWLRSVTSLSQEPL